MINTFTGIRFLLFPAFLLAFLFVSVPAKSQGLSLPYFNDFEGGAAPFTDSTVAGSAWQFGTPLYGFTTGAHSGSNAWDVELAATYAANSKCYLYSPLFSMGGSSHAVLSFWQNRNVEPSWDGMHLEYSTDGINWLLMDSVGDPNATNWYTSSLIFSSGLPAWDGFSNGWIKSSFRLAGLGVTGNISFRFVFSSDNSGQLDGVSIDDFELYHLPAADAGVSAIQNFSFLPAGTVSSPFNITVKNFGSQPFNSFSVSYSVNSGPAFTVASTFNLLPNNVVNLVVPGFTVPSGQYSICAWTTLLNDTSHFNDTLCTLLMGLTAGVLPYTNDFEGSADWITYSGTPGNAWQLGTPTYGTTNTTHSGVKCWDVNLSTGYTAGALCYLYSPVFDFTGVFNASLNFFYNKNTGVNDGVFLQYSVNVGSTWQSLGSFQDPSAVNWYNGFVGSFPGQPAWTGNSTWQPASYPLSLLNNADSVIFRFVFSSYASSGDGFSIDDLGISVPSAVDAGIMFIQAPVQVPAGTVVPSVPVTVKNYGSQQLDSVTASYTINGILASSGSFLVGLLPGATAVVSLPGYSVPSGSYSLCAYTSVVADGNNVNDTLCKGLFGSIVHTLPFFDSFDAGNSGWGQESLQNPSDSWMLGTPVTGIPNAAFSSPSCWDINLNSPYFGPSICHLYTPFFNFTNAVHPVLSFWQNRNIELAWDGMRIEYSVNLGNWLPLGYFGDPNGNNWYNYAFINSSGVHGWTGISNGWENCSYNLDPLAIPNGSFAQFRFIFTADAQVMADGVAIDDFAITLALAQDAALTALVSPSNNVSAGTAVPVSVDLKNNGLQPLTSLDIIYDVNGTLSGPFNWTGNLLTDSQETFTMPAVIPVVGTNNITVYISWVSDLNKYNDTIRSTFNGVYSVGIPYSIDFESGALGWDVYASSFANTQWELGKPFFGATTGAYSGDSCWDVNLTSECGNLANTILYTPVFNFSNANNSRLSCWINYDTEPYADGFYIEYSTNGTFWQTLGTVNDPAGYNWYNGNLTNNQPGWSISSQGWKNAIFNTSFLDGSSYARFRYKFTTDFAITSTGASMDDFSITNFTGVGENNPSGFTIYPSPVTELLTLAIEGRQEVTGIEIINVMGQKVYTVQNPSNENGTYILNVTSLSPGMYFVSVNTVSGIIVKSIIKN